MFVFIILFSGENNMLVVDHVTKKYGKNIACNDVSFVLDPGSLSVLLGPNGAGKSTIMKSIIGFLKYSGSITVNGIPNKTSEARRVLGYIPEMPSLYPTLTVVEHMEFIARASGLGTPFLKDERNEANRFIWLLWSFSLTS